MKNNLEHEKEIGSITIARISELVENAKKERDKEWLEHIEGQREKIANIVYASSIKEFDYKRADQIIALFKEVQ